MITDTSALVTVAVHEPGWEQVVGLLDRSDKSQISAMTLLELRIVLSNERFNAAHLVDELLRRYGIKTIDFTADHADEAARAYRRFGRGRHPARLNFGDCASYATAKLTGQPLLYVGDDFSRTDIESAL